MFKLSAITATRNRADLLQRCIESAASQDYAPKEHVIIDGASTDGTVELLKSAAARYPHLRWISESDRGLSHALNKGLALATGDAVGVIGDDDFYEPGAFRAVASEFGKFPETGVVTGDCRNVRNDGSTVQISKAAYTNRHELIDYWKHWGRTVFIPAPGTFIRRQAIDKVGGFEESDRYAMDYRHWIKITEHFSVRTVGQVLANFRCDEGSISFSLEAKQRSESIAISKDYWGSPLSWDYYRFLVSYAKFFGIAEALFTIARRAGRQVIPHRRPELAGAQSSATPSFACGESGPARCK
ncbi:MAG: glycosyltransferase family 2 protein [Bryobacteraceae bacterium]